MAQGNNFNPNGAKTFSPPNATPLNVRSNSPMQLGPLANVRMPSSPVPVNSPIPVPKLQSKAPMLQRREASMAGGEAPSARGSASSTSPFWNPREQEAQRSPAPSQSQIHQFEVLGLGPDGAEQSYIHEVEFPPGTRVLGVRCVSSE